MPAYVAFTCQCKPCGAGLVSSWKQHWIILVWTHVNATLWCRAGLKLEAALDHFGVDVRGLRVLDSGLSTGGFADCLLQRGAAHVVGVDVGYGQVSRLLPLFCFVHEHVRESS